MADVPIKSPDAPMQGSCTVVKYNDGIVVNNNYFNERLPLSPTLSQNGVVPTNLAAELTKGKRRIVGSLPLVGLPLVGRTEILGQLRSCFAVETAKTFALFGLGGIGKSRIALNFLSTCDPPYDTVWWIDSATWASVDRSAQEFATEFGFNGTRLFDDIAHWLECNDRWLIVADNLSEPQLLRRIVNPDRRRGHLLITTRDRGIVSFFPSASEVRSLTPAESKKLIQSCVLGGDGVEGIIGLLGGHPLALIQAAAYVASCGRSFSNYAGEWGARRQSFLRQTSTDISVMTTIAMSIDLVVKKSPQAQQLLQHLSMLAPSPVERRWLLPDGPVPLTKAVKAAVPNDDALDNGIKALLSASLLEVTSSDTYRIHPVVQEIVLSLLSAHDVQMLQILTLECQGQFTSRMASCDAALLSRYLPHVVALLDRMDLKSWGSECKILHEDLNRMVFLGIFCPIARAIRDRADAIGWRVEAAKAGERLAEALDEWMRIDEETGQTHNPVRPEYLMSVATAARLWGYCGTPDAHARAAVWVETCISELGKTAILDEDRRAAVWHRLGLALRSIGDLERARFYTTSSLAYDERRFKRAQQNNVDQDSISRLAIHLAAERDNYAKLLVDLAESVQGEKREQRLLEAEGLVRSAIELAERYADPESYALALHRQNLGAILQHLGRWPESLEWLHKAEPIVLQHFPPGHFELQVFVDRMFRAQVISACKSLGETRTCLAKIRMELSNCTIGVARALHNSLFTAIVNREPVDLDLALEVEETAIEIILALSGDYVASDLAGIYGTLDLLPDKPEHLQESLARVVRHVESLGYSKEEFLKVMIPSLSKNAISREEVALSERVRDRP